MARNGIRRVTFDLPESGCKRKAVMEEEAAIRWLPLGKLKGSLIPQDESLASHGKFHFLLA